MKGSFWQTWFGAKDLESARAAGDVRWLSKQLGAPEYRSWSAAMTALEELRAIDALTAALTHPNMDVRKAAATALGRIGDPRAVPALAAALRDPGRIFHQIAYSSGGTLHHPVRTAAADALASLGAAGLAVLLEALAYEDLQSAAYLAIGEIKGPHAVPLLVAALSASEEYHAQKALLERLRELRDSDADAAIEAFRSSGRNKWAL